MLHFLSKENIDWCSGSTKKIVLASLEASRHPMFLLCQDSPNQVWNHAPLSSPKIPEISVLAQPTNCSCISGRHPCWWTSFFSQDSNNQVGIMLHFPGQRYQRLVYLLNQQIVLVSLADTLADHHFPSAGTAVIKEGLCFIFSTNCSLISGRLPCWSTFFLCQDTSIKWELCFIFLAKDTRD